MSLTELHPQLFDTLFDYLTQQELLNIVFLNSMICNISLEYILKIGQKSKINENGKHFRKSFIKYLISNECIISIRFLIAYHPWFDTMQYIMFYSYKYGKLIENVKKHRELYHESVLHGAAAANNQSVIIGMLNYISNCFYFEFNETVCDAYIYCNNVETMAIIKKRSQVGYPFKLISKACNRNITEFIRHFSNDGKFCNGCFQPIEGHQMSPQFIADVCRSYNIRKIKKYGDGRICGHCGLLADKHPYWNQK